MEEKSVHQESITRGSGQMMPEMDREELFLRMALTILVSGKIITGMGRESMYEKMVLRTLASGQMASVTELLK